MLHVTPVARRCRRVGRRQGGEWRDGKWVRRNEGGWECEEEDGQDARIGKEDRREKMEVEGRSRRNEGSQKRSGRGENEGG